MPSSLLASLAKEHGIPPETMQAALLSLAAAIGNPPAPIEEAPEPAPPQLLPMPVFANPTMEESDTEFEARNTAYEQELAVVVKHNKGEKRRFHNEREAYMAYRSYIEAARKCATQFPIHIQAARKRQREQEAVQIRDVDNVRNRKRAKIAATVESPAPPQENNPVPDTSLPRCNSPGAESHLTVTAAGPKTNPLNRIQDAITRIDAQLHIFREIMRQNQQLLSQVESVSRARRADRAVELLAPE